jgi:hypothetical protein
MRNIITIFFIILLSACFEYDDQIVCMKVLNDKFELLAEFNKDTELRKIERIWKSREEIKSDLKPVFKLKIDIATKKRSNRWLYDPNGYCMLLSKAKVPIYRIQKYKELNKMINP